MISWLILFVLMLGTSAHARDLTVPDPMLTPGAVTELTTKEICERKWGKDARNVTATMKREVFASYGLPGNKRTRECRGDAHGRIFEIDHLISRELGGADEVKNLWPQCYSGPWNAVRKDRVENRLHREVCAGNIDLQQAQQEIAKDWRIPFRHYFGE